MRDFLLGLKWVNPFVVWTFEVRRIMLLILKWEDTPAGSLNKVMEEGSFCSLSAFSHFANTSIPSLALMLTTLEFQCPLKTS